MIGAKDFVPAREDGGKVRMQISDFEGVMFAVNGGRHKDHTPPALQPRPEFCIAVFENVAKLVDHFKGEKARYRKSKQANDHYSYGK